MDNNRKELIAGYKDREVTGGVCAIVNEADNKTLLEIALDIHGSQNRFDFSKKTGSCVNFKLQSDWQKHGADVFTFKILEELKRGENQTDKEFKEDLNALKDVWAEKIENLY